METTIRALAKLSPRRLALMHGPSFSGHGAAVLFHRAMIAWETRRALNKLPDDLLRDIGLSRGEISYVADTVASGAVETRAAQSTVVENSN